MNNGGLIEVNSETGKTKEVKTTGTRPHPQTCGHTSNINGNEIIVYGGYYYKENKCYKHSTPFKLSMDKKNWTIIQLKGFIPRTGHCSF